MSGCQNGYSSDVYEKTNCESKKIPRNIVVYTFITVPILYVIPMVYKSYRGYFATNYSPDSFLLFYNIAWVFWIKRAKKRPHTKNEKNSLFSIEFVFKLDFRLPFDWKGSFSYIIATVIQMVFFLGVLEIFVTFLVIYFGICEFCVAFVDDIEDRFLAFKQFVDTNHNSQQEIYEKLCKIIEFHTNAIQ